jgi:predicted homoserine dehydrogenase-like protein
VIKAVEQDHPITYGHVELHEPSTILSLRRLQDAWMAGRAEENALAASLDAMAIE